MKQIRYGIWFEGNADESAGLCFEGRDAAAFRSKENAEKYCDDIGKNKPANIYHVVTMEWEDGK